MGLVATLVAIVPLVREIPALARAGSEIYNKLKNQRQSQESHGDDSTDAIQELRTDVENIQQRLEVQEASTEAQVEIIVQLTRHNAVLARWLLFMAIAFALTSGVAIAALLLTLLT